MNISPETVASVPAVAEPKSAPKTTEAPAYDDVYVQGHGEALVLDVILIGDQENTAKAKAAANALADLDKRCKDKGGIVIAKPQEKGVTCSYLGVIAFGRVRCVSDVETNSCRVARK